MPPVPALIALAVLVVAACAAPVQIDGLAGRTFLSQAVTEGGVARPLVGGTQIRLDFRPDGMLGATAGCNSMGGTWRLDGDVLRVEQGAMTAIGCRPELHEQDEWLSRLLTSAPRVTLAGDGLFLHAGNTVVELLDREVAEPDQPLTGTLWTVESIRSGDAVSSVPRGARATLLIADDGSASIATGCNEGGARATIEGDQLRFTELITTPRACLDAAADLERTFLEVLRSDVLRWSVDADRLTLDAGAVGLDLRAG